MRKSWFGGSKAETSALTVDGLEVQLVRKAVRGLRLSVYPDGRIRLSAPRRTSDRAVMAFIRDRMDWVHKQRARWGSQPIQQPLQFIHGEEHHFLGEAYPLQIVDSTKGVLLQDGRLFLSAPKESDRALRELLLKQWYRKQLEAVATPLFERHEPIMGVRASDWTIRQMKTRWGSCNPGSRRISLSLELAKKPLDCIEYVVVHELAHLIEASHNARFWGLMDRYYPNWRMHKKILNTVC